MQCLEDVICLVFLESYLADFSSQHDDNKVIDIIQKTWKKMSPQGRQVALTLRLPAAAQALIESALTA